MALARSSNKRRSKGFTLVEIMVVVVILGLLATVVGRNVIPMLFQSQEDKAKVDVKTITGAIEMFQLKNRRLPEDIEELITPDDKGNAILKQETVPVDPWGNEYVIENHPDRDNQKICRCYGPDGEPDTGDDITSLNITGKDREK